MKLSARPIYLSGRVDSDLPAVMQSKAQSKSAAKTLSWDAWFQPLPERLIKTLATEVERSKIEGASWAALAAGEDPQEM